MLNEEIVCEIEPDVILEALCEALELDQAAVLGPRRFPVLADARCMAIYLIRKHSDLTLNEVAKVMDRADHSTMIYSLKRFSDLHFSSNDFNNKLELVKHNLKNKGYDC